MSDEGPAMGDCEVCGWSISYGDPDGTLHPDADVFCDECGARYICNVEDEDAYLVLGDRPTDRIASLARDRDVLRARVAELEGQIRDANHRCNDAWRDLNDSRAKAKDLDTHVLLQRGQLGELRAEVERLRADLRRYGQHEASCWHNRVARRCTCGLDAALGGEP